jgi:hypothetical protein
VIFVKNPGTGRFLFFPAHILAHMVFAYLLPEARNHVSFENIQETHSALYSLRSELSNEVSFGVLFHLKKKLGLVNFLQKPPMSKL